MQSILILLHCESNTGYAIGPLEATFFKMALAVCGNDHTRIHFAYPSMEKGPSSTLPADFRQYVVIDARKSDIGECQKAAEYIRKHNIDTIFGFDQPVSRPIYKYFRKAGVKHFISYWGAPMSSIFGPLKRALKRIEVSFRRHGPDHYIFESYGMADTAVLGRGISRQRTSVVYLGVDTKRFYPDVNDETYVYDQFNIPRNRRIFFYSGHMEPRKGVAVIMQAANMLASQRSVGDWQILLFGNKNGEEQPYLNMMSPDNADKIMFCGYRSDLPRVLRGCYGGIIASTGWDSFPRSAMEIQATGIPLIVSKLPGLQESVEHERTGLLFSPGDHKELAHYIADLLDNPPLRNTLAENALQRIRANFSIEKQLENLTEILKVQVR